MHAFQIQHNDTEIERVKWINYRKPHFFFHLTRMKSIRAIQETQLKWKTKRTKFGQLTQFQTVRGHVLSCRLLTNTWSFKIYVSGFLVLPGTHTSVFCTNAIKNWC